MPHPGSTYRGPQTAPARPCSRSCRPHECPAPRLSCLVLLPSPFESPRCASDGECDTRINERWGAWLSGAVPTPRKAASAAVPNLTIWYRFRRPLVSAKTIVDSLNGSATEAHSATRLRQYLIRPGEIPLSILLPLSINECRARRCMLHRASGVDGRWSQKPMRGGSRLHLDTSAGRYISTQCARLPSRPARPDSCEKPL